MPTTKARKRKHYKRQKITGFRPQPDDYEILDLARRRRLITTHHVRMRFPHRSEQGIGRRFTKLFDVGWLEKDGVQNPEFIDGGGSHAHNAAITEDGYEALAAYKNLPSSSTRFDWNNKRLRPTSVPHILETTKFAVAVEISAEKHKETIVADLSHEILETLDVEPQRKSKPLSFTVPDVRWQGTTAPRGIEPDDLLRLTYTDLPVGKNVAPFLVEIDLEKETVDPKTTFDKPTFWTQSSILKKDVIYINAFLARSKRPTCGHFGFKTFRSLYVTRTRGHMKEMQECEIKYFSDGPLAVRPGFILYTNWEHIEAHEYDVLGMPWEDRLGRPVYIDGENR